MGTGVPIRKNPGVCQVMIMRDRGRTKLARNKGEDTAESPSKASENPTSLPKALSRVDESSVSAMAPGDVFLLDEIGAVSPYSEPAFHAILACPLCGGQVLISTAQYLGFAPILCASRTCPGFFRIVDDGRFVYLPVN
jgi:hypothetical protein